MTSGPLHVLNDDVRTPGNPFREMAREQPCVQVVAAARISRNDHQDRLALVECLNGLGIRTGNANCKSGPCCSEHLQQSPSLMPPCATVHPYVPRFCGFFLLRARALIGMGSAA